MFSHRTSWDRTENRLTRAIQQARSAGREPFDLTESNPTRAGIFDLEQLIAELGHPRGAIYAPVPRGHGEGRRAVASYYRQRGYTVDPERLVLSASTSEAYAWIFSLLADADDSVLIPRPSYPLFSWIAAQQKVRLVTYPLQRDAGFRIDLGELRRAVDARTRAIVLVHPNNPTGSFVRRDEAAELCELAKEHHLALVVDEVFGDYGFEPFPTDALPSFLDVERAPLTFVLSGLSKVMLLPQCKLGWTVVRGPDDLVAEAMARLELIADTYLSVSTPVQLALPAMLERRPKVQAATRQRLRDNLAALDGAIAELGPSSSVRRLPCAGGWYAVLEVPRIHDEETWVELLIREEDAIVHPGYFFDFDRDGFLVVSLLPEVRGFRDAVGRVVRRLGRG
jgi:aspartate/methionine/tyrosine aminotransferase